MTGLSLFFILAAFIIAVPATWAVRQASRRVGAMDGPGVAGQVKASAPPVPNTGGMGIVAGLVAPIAAGMAVLGTDTGRRFAAARAPAVMPYLDGVRGQSRPALVLLACVLVLHVVGLVDDRRPLGPYLKLAFMLLVSLAAVMLTGSRLLTLLDAPAGGAWLSIVLTVLWVVVVTNAFNFLDNMDGLAGGVVAVCAAFFLVTALMMRQWFVAATLASLVGAVLGFLVFNFPFLHPLPRPGPGAGAGRRASIFMGDGGSLVVGFVLALMSVRITYVHAPGTPADPGAPGFPATPWYSVFIPLIILAIPLYDFCSVTLIRLSQGRSPFVGDLQHFSHRLVGHGLSRRDAVLVICGAACATGIGAVMLPSLAPWQALLVGVQTLLIILVIALYEWSRGAVEGRRE